MPRHFGVAATGTDHVDDARDLLQLRLNLIRDGGEPVGIIAKDLDLDGIGTAFEVAQHVLQQLDEFNLSVGRRLSELAAKRLDDLIGGMFARAARLEPHDDVARVLLRGEQSQFRSGPSRERRNLVVVGEDGFDRAEALVGSRQRRAGRRQIVDDKAALIRRRQKAGAHLSVAEHGDTGEHQHGQPGESRAANPGR